MSDRAGRAVSASQGLSAPSLEQALVGTLLLFPAQAREIFDRFGDADITDRDLRACSETMRKECERGAIYDVAVLRGALNSRNPGREWGNYLLSVIDAGTAPGAAQEHAAKLHALGVRRRTIAILSATAQTLAECPGEEMGSSLARMHDGIAAEVCDHNNYAVSVRDALRQFYEVAELAAKEGKPPTVSTGMPTLDRLTGGMAKGQVVVVASRPGVGKTSFAANVALAAARQRKTVAFFSLEMLPMTVAGNMQAILGEVNLHVIYSRRLTREELDGLGAVVREIAPLPITFVYQPRLAVSQIGPICRSLARPAPPDLVIVDYLQLLGMERAENRNVQVGAAMREIKLTAEDIGAPLMLLAQLNRAMDREHRPPILSDLRESGSIEQDADQVWMLHRACMGLSREELEKRKANGKTSEDDYMTIYVRKNRHGPTGIVNVGWDASHLRLTDDAEESSPRTFAQPRGNERKDLA